MGFGRLVILFLVKVNTGVKICMFTSLLEWRERGFAGTVRSRNQSSKESGEVDPYVRALSKRDGTHH